MGCKTPEKGKKAAPVKKDAAPAKKTDKKVTREDYGLRLPGRSFPPAHGDAHRRQCLEALALFGLEGADG